MENDTNQIEEKDVNYYDLYTEKRKEYYKDVNFDKLDEVDTRRMHVINAAFEKYKELDKLEKMGINTKKSVAQLNDINEEENKKQAEWFFENIKVFNEVITINKYIENNTRINLNEQILFITKYKKKYNATSDDAERKINLCESKKEFRLQLARLLYEDQNITKKNDLVADMEKRRLIAIRNEASDRIFEEKRKYLGLEYNEINIQQARDTRNENRRRRGILINEVEIIEHIEKINKQQI